MVMKSIDEQICDLYKKKRGAFNIARDLEIGMDVVWGALEQANLVRKSKIVPIGTLVAVRRFGGAAHKLGRVVRPCKPPGHYYIVCGMNNITHWGAWSGAMDDPKTVVCSSCKCDTKILVASGCQCEGGKKITKEYEPNWLPGEGE
jgi:hypothetical protein